MRVLLHSLNGTSTAVELGLLVQFSVGPKHDRSYITEVRMNELGEIVIDLYKHSISKTEPVYSQIYEVVK